jgi:hypothetical protein
VSTDRIAIDRLSTRAFLLALGGPNPTRGHKIGNGQVVTPKVLALLRLRAHLGVTDYSIIVEYVYGWDPDGGPYNPIGSLHVLLCKHYRDTGRRLTRTKFGQGLEITAEALAEALL